MVMKLVAVVLVLSALVAVHAGKAEKGTVVDLTDKDFDKIVMNAKKDVLVEFYAPWCGHCKRLAPVYDELAAAFANEKDVVIAKMDSTAHRDAPGRYGVKGFPTIKMFSKADKEEPLEYEGGRELKDFVAYINGIAGTHRAPGGGLNEMAGRLEDFDTLAQAFFADPDERAELLEMAKELAGDLSGKAAKSAKVYVGAMEHALEHGVAWIEAERLRFEDTLSSLRSTGGKANYNRVRANVLAAFGADAEAEEEEGDEAVVTLDEDNWEDVVESGDAGVLVKFYAPWCGHCKTLAPKYEKAAQAFAEHGDKVVVAKLDATQNKELAEKFDVSGYPTLKYFTPGKSAPEEYNAGREFADLVRFLNGKSGLDVSTSPVEDDDEYGTVPALDKLAASFSDAGEAQQAKLLEDAAALAAKLEGEEATFAAYYLHYMRVLADEPKRAKKEKKKLRKTFENIETPKAAAQAAQARYNVLSAF